MSNGIPEPDSKAQPQQVHRGPAYAAWFCHDRLHQLEVRGLPEYFQSSNPIKNPRVAYQAACPEGLYFTQHVGAFASLF